MLARTEAVRDVGLLDAGFFMYCEEMDWCRRSATLGYEALCVPKAVVTHHAGASTRQRAGPMFVALWRSRLRYFAKHEGPVRARVLRGTVRAAIRARRVSDRVAQARGRIDAEARRERSRAYAAILAGGAIP